MKKHVIWADTMDWVDSIENDIRENPDEYSGDECADDYEISSLAYEMLGLYRDDERANLDKELDKDIVVIGTAGCWDGKHHNVSRIGRNLSITVDAPYSGMDEEEIFIDRYNLCWTGSHHDGRNSAVFRKMKDNSKYDTFIEALMRADENDDEAAWNRAVSRYTTSLRKEVAEIYGW